MICREIFNASGATMTIHFRLGRILVAGILVDQIGSGVMLGSITINGGRSSAHLVQTTDGPRVVPCSDVVCL
jgi:hypothetical protein